MSALFASRSTRSWILLGAMLTPGLISGCGQDELPLSSTETSAAVPIGSDWIVESTPLDFTPVEGPELEIRTGKFPLNLGNHWTWLAHVQLQVESGNVTDAPQEIWRTTRAQITGSESHFGRCYAVEERTITEDTDPAAVVTETIRYRQDASGLYEADLPIVGPPPASGGANATFFDGRPQSQAWERAAQTLRNRVTQLRGSLAQSAAMPGGGVRDNEITRLAYPLHPGQVWDIRSSGAELWTSRVLGRTRLDLPVGKTAAWAVSIESTVFGPQDEVVTFWGRDGFLGWRVLSFLEVIGDDGSVLGTLRFTDEEYLQNAELMRREAEPCDGATVVGTRRPQTAIN